MGWYRNLKISAKLIIGFLVVAVITGFIGLVGIISLSKISDNAEVLYANATEPMAQLSEVLELYLEIRVELRNLVLIEDDAETLKERINGINSRIEEIVAIMAECEKTAYEDSTRQMFDTFDSSVEDFVVIMNQVIDLVQDGNIAEAKIVLFDETMAKIATTVQDVIESLVDNKVSGGKSQYDTIVSTSENSKLMMLVFLFLV
ncbi:MAG TPA: MCP four helix bundle domain-containing protein [Thermoclostridium sp.]